MPLTKTLTPQKTFTATIYVGVVEGYDGPAHTFEEVRDLLQGYCNTKGFCVTMTQTEFIYTSGIEPGVIVGLIQYPRFPMPEAELEIRAVEIATKLMLKLGQTRVSIVFTDETITLEREKELA